MSFALLGFLPHTRLFVETAALELTEQSLTGQLLLCDFEGFFDVIIKNFDFHPVGFQLSQAKLACCLWFLITLQNRGRSLTQHLEFLKDFGHLGGSDPYLISKCMILLNI